MFSPMLSILLIPFIVAMFLAINMGGSGTAPCFGIGSSIFGSRVIQTTGKEIIEFGPMGATLLSIVTASLLLFASAAGVSLHH